MTTYAWDLYAGVGNIPGAWGYNSTIRIYVNAIDKNGADCSTEFFAATPPVDLYLTATGKPAQVIPCSAIAYRDGDSSDGEIQLDVTGADLGSGVLTLSLDPPPVFRAAVFGTYTRLITSQPVFPPLRSTPGVSDSPEPGECPDDRPDTGMLYPRG